jgi:hypothetical protein
MGALVCERALDALGGQDTMPKASQMDLLATNELGDGERRYHLIDS